MDIKEFLDLPESVKEEIVRIHNTQKQIREERERIELEEKKIQTRKLNLQTGCEHPSAIKIPKADTGNWCKADDSYWYECSCPDCGRRWIEDR